MIKPCNSGIMKYRGRLYEQAQIDDYSFVYSFDKNAQKDDD